MIRLLLALAVIGAACSDPKQQHDGGTPDADPANDPNDGATSGSRLKLQYYDFGGTHVLTGVRDTQRSEDCFPTPWTDGTTYCTPTSRGSVVFANATCTQRVALHESSGTCPRPPATYFTQYADEPCAAGGGRIEKIYGRGAPIVVTEYFNLDSAGTCNGPYTSTNAQFFALGAELPSAELVALTPTEPTATGRLGTRFHTSADGLRYPDTTLVDAELATSCYLNYAPALSTTGRCDPLSNASAYYFRDAACTSPQVSVGSTCPAPQLAVKYDQCPYGLPRYFSVGAPATPTSVFTQDSAGTCTAQAAPVTERYYELGAERMTATTTRTRGTGTARIQPIHHTTAEGLRARDHYLFDTQLGMECSPRLRSDGTVTCLPQGTPPRTYYTDATCQTSILVLRQYRGGPTCSAPPAPTHSVEYTAGTGCEFELTLRRVGPVFTNRIYELTGTTCTEYIGPQQTFYSVLDVVPASDIASATLVTEP